MTRLIVTFGIFLALCLQWMVITALTFLAGGELVFLDPQVTLACEFFLALGGAILAVTGTIYYFRLERKCG